jgi:hypothetical protein
LPTAAGKMAPSAALPLSGGAGNKLHGLFQRHPGNPKITSKKYFHDPKKYFHNVKKKYFTTPFFTSEPVRCQLRNPA